MFAVERWYVQHLEIREIGDISTSYPSREVPPPRISVSDDWESLALVLSKTPRRTSVGVVCKRSCPHRPNLEVPIIVLRTINNIKNFGPLQL